MRHPRLALLLALLGGACADAPKQATEGLPGPLGRCAHDGLCVVRDDNRLLAVGYREGDYQIAYDAVRGDIDPVARAMGGRDICQRIIWHGTHQAWHESGGGCPPEWSTGGAVQYGTAPDEYVAMMPRMAAAMANVTVGAQWQETWQHTTQELAIWGQVPPAWTDDDELPDYPAEPPYAPAQGSADHALYGFLGGSSQASSSSSSLTPEYGKDTPPVAPLTRTKGPYLFTQTIEIWAQPVRNLLIMGDMTNAQHSGTIAYVYRTKLPPAPVSWQLVDKVVSRNHGAEPKYGTMKRIARCENLAVTHQQYVTGGCMEEASGIWPFHLCNDDTTLQVLHANGMDVFGNPVWSNIMTQTRGPGRWTSDMPSDGPRREKRMRAPDCHPYLRWQLAEWDR